VVNEVENNGLQFQRLKTTDSWQQFRQTEKVVPQFRVQSGQSFAPNCRLELVTEANFLHKAQYLRGVLIQLDIFGSRSIVFP
jgi:hypothetical protein